MTAASLMMTDFPTVQPELSLLAALAVMRHHGNRHLLVVDELGALAGVLSNRDWRKLLEWAGPEGKIPNLDGVTVGQIMTPREHVVAARPDASVFALAELLIAHRIGFIPIVDAHSRPIGAVTPRAVVETLLTLARPS